MTVLATHPHKKVHHSNQFLVITNHTHTCMFCHHVSAHFPGTNLDEVHLLLVVHPVPNAVILRQNLFGASMVDWVVDEVQGRLAVEEDSNRGGDFRLSLHLELELSKEAGLPPSYGKRHVLTFARAQAGFPC